MIPPESYVSQRSSEFFSPRISFYDCVLLVDLGPFVLSTLKINKVIRAERETADRPASFSVIPRPPSCTQQTIYHHRSSLLTDLLYRVSRDLCCAFVAAPFPRPSGVTSGKPDSGETVPRAIFPGFQRPKDGPTAAVDGFFSLVSSFFRRAHFRSGSGSRRKRPARPSDRRTEVFPPPAVLIIRIEDFDLNAARKSRARSIVTVEGIVRTARTVRLDRVSSPFLPAGRGFRHTGWT